jgi:beta-lactamase superfamily II metal-dependent hydrolase
MAVRYINDCDGKFTVPLRDGQGKSFGHMLWGDPVHVENVVGDKTWVKTGRSTDQAVNTWVPTSCVTNNGILEIYVIDVGQGDGVLMRAPDDKWHVIDAGISNSKQMTKKGAANFIRWKFQTDLRKPGVDLESATISHPDFDHYGGMLDLLAGKLWDGRTFPVTVKNFYHSGMGRFADAPKLGAITAGVVSDMPFPFYGVQSDDDFITELLTNKQSFAAPPRPFDEAFADLAGLVATVPANVGRLSADMHYFPGYDAGNASGVTIHLLGPVLENIGGGKRGLRVLGSESVTRNGHSIVMRLDFGEARILLTGDLNTASQRLLLSYRNSTEFAADVVKGCHHGSDDIDMRFVKAMAARSTVISSGDNEDYAHPRPRVMGASAKYGRESKDTRGDILPPLIYSTELARSVKLDYAASFRKQNTTPVLLKASEAEVKPLTGPYRDMDRTPIATDLVYGLVNVRTDGRRVLCATMKEQGNEFDMKVFRAGVEA